MTARSLLRRPMGNYKGLEYGCAPGTHATLLSLIVRHVSPCAGVLDLGAHAGALLLRLQEAGFTGLVGTDLDTTKFKLSGADFKKLELNQAFSREFTKRFRLITCTDVIEHLDSPRNFLMEARELLEDGGWVAISLPNVAFWKGRCKFLLNGELWGFGERNYRVQRHISPITFEQMKMMMEEIGFRLVESGTCGSFATPLSSCLTFPIWGPMRLVGGAHVLGECAIFLGQKARPDENLKSPTDYRKRWAGISD